MAERADWAVAAAVERCSQPDAEFVFEAGCHQVIEAEHGWRRDVSGFHQVPQTGLVHSLLKLHRPGGQTDFPASMDVTLRLSAFQQLELNVITLGQREPAGKTLGKHGVLVQGGEDCLGGIGDVVLHA